LEGERVKKWYEELFEDYAETYDKQPFTSGTLAEVDFIEREIGYDKSVRILDIGCGTGRHAIELARRGYDVTGVDLSASQLGRAREKAQAAGVAVRFQQADARQLRFRGGFQLVIMICEGAFPLMETDEENFAILGSAAAALEPNGKLICTTLNALFPLFHSVKEFLDSNPAEGCSRDNRFDLTTFRDHSLFEAVDDSGRTKTLSCNERYYAPSEMTWLLKSLGFRKVEVFGCPTGNFSRENKLTPGDFEMLVVAGEYAAASAIVARCAG
jgi:2-polyprenyl-3-methyl-5-hydroxy-6-metoxy-1,4-benzoquinol methylase